MSASTLKRMKVFDGEDFLEQVAKKQFEKRDKYEQMIREHPKQVEDAESEIVNFLIKELATAGECGRTTVGFQDCSTHLILSKAPCGLFSGIQTKLCGGGITLEWNENLDTLKIYPHPWSRRDCYKKLRVGGDKCDTLALYRTFPCARCGISTEYAGEFCSFHTKEELKNHHCTACLDLLYPHRHDSPKFNHCNYD